MTLVSEHHPRSRRVSRIAALFVLLTPIVVVSSSPTLPPPHEYVVDGSVVRPGGGDLAGFAVVLMYKWKQEEPAPWSRSTTARLTNANGWFQVAGTFYGQGIDSLAPAWVSPDTVIMGTAFSAGEDPGSPNQSLHTQDGFFCDKDKWEVDSYIHFYYEKTLILP